MRRILIGFGLALSGLFGLLVCAACWPLLTALRSDRRERSAGELGRFTEYDDNDLGRDVDDVRLS